MKNTNKLFALFMTLLIALPLLFSCAPATSGSQNTTGADVSTDAPPFEKTGKTYDGADYNVLLGSLAGDCFNDFKYVEEEPTVLDVAIQKKNVQVETEFDVKIVYTEKFKDSQSYTLMSQAYSSGDVSFHTAFIPGYDIVPLAYSNVLYDLKSVPYIDLSHAWWDQNANSEFEILGKVYFTTGDISIQDDLQQFCIAFNKELFEQKGYDDIYATLKADKWTYDVLYSYAKDMTDDVNGDDKMDMQDEYGILTWDDSIYGVFSSGGSKILNVNDGKIEMTFKGDEAVFSALVEYTEQIKNIGINYSQRWSEGAGEAAIKMFTEDRALFLLGRISSFNSFRDMETNYGILPYPKYSESQENYYTIISGYHANYVCTLNLEADLDMRGEITEALAYYSSIHLTPAFQEKTLKGQQVRDDESLISLEIMAGSRMYDLGYLMRPGKIDAQLIYLFRDLDTTYASTFEKYTILAKNDIKSANEAFAAISQ